MPKVSVIVPLYNKEAQVGRTLDSVLAQSFEDFEVIVVDDGSTDAGPEIAGGYDDPRIRLVRQPNAGPGAARNRGMRDSAADIVSFLDADDEYLPRCLQRVVECFEAHPDCALVGVGMTGGDDAERWRRSLRRRGLTDGVWEIPPDCTWRQLGAIRSFFTTSSVAHCRREAALKLGGFYEKHRCTYGEDGYLWVQMFLRHKVYLCTEQLTWYHMEASQLGWAGRGEVMPPQPLVTDPAPVRRRCPRRHRAMLEDYLGYLALLTARRYVCDGRDWVSARRVLRSFPAARRLGSVYVRTYLKMFHWPFTQPLGRLVRSTPWLRRLAREVKRLLRGRR